MASTKLINDPNAAVLECLEGLVACQPNLTRLDGFPGVKVILRKDLDPSKVALVSGGGSGHEPAHAGYIGDGMLSAAVCGEVFASPSTDAVYAAIKAVTGPAGCLLIVKNYTGDRLNFGLAAERAKKDGLSVDMVVVGEDCALPPPLGLAGRRGLAGTILVHKIAGAAARAGGSLADVTAAAAGAAGRIGTMGAALSVCSLPGGAPPDRLAPGEMELGLGIHGEPGAEKCPAKPVDWIVDHLLDCITSEERGYLPVKAGEEVVLLVNSLGATTGMELYIAARAALSSLARRGASVKGVMVGHFMTALDMAGMSLTIMKGADAFDLEALRAPVGAPAWPPCAFADIAPSAPIAIAPPPAAPGGTRPDDISASGALIEKCVLAACCALEGMEAQLTEWDSKIGDGDCGHTMRDGAAALRKAVASCNVNDPAAVAEGFAAAVGEHMGGTSGALYAIFFSAAAVSLHGKGPAPPVPAWAAAYRAAVSAITKYGGAPVGARTMVDAMEPAAAALEAAQGGGGAAAAAAAAAAAETGAEGTRALAAQAGRASYVRAEALEDVPDPGAKAAAAWLGAVAAALA